MACLASFTFEAMQLVSHVTFCKPHAENVAFNRINLSACLASFTFEPNSLAIHLIPRHHPWNLLCLKAFLTTMFCVEFIHVIESLLFPKRQRCFAKNNLYHRNNFVCGFHLLEISVGFYFEFLWIVLKFRWTSFWNPVNFFEILWTFCQNLEKKGKGEK